MIRQTSEVSSSIYELIVMREELCQKITLPDHRMSDKVN